jgi:hypothetical protein
MRSIQICNKKLQSVVASGLVSGANNRTPCYSVLYAIALVVGPRDTPCNIKFSSLTRCIAARNQSGWPILAPDQSERENGL